MSVAIESSGNHTIVDLIVSPDPTIRDQSLIERCSRMGDDEILLACEELDNFWQQSDNLYERVRSLMFLAAMHRFVLPSRGISKDFHPLPQTAVERLFSRRFEHAISSILQIGDFPRKSDTYASALAAAYHGAALQALADQVRHCVRHLPGNQWMFRTGHPSEIPLRIRPELTHVGADGQRPLLVERTAVRMDLSHSAWSDIFFLAMDRPEFAKVLNVSVNLCQAGEASGPQPPVEAWFRVIDAPVIRLVSVDLSAQVTIDNLPEVFDFGRDYLGLLKAALVASGLIPAGLEGCGADLKDVLKPLVGEGHGFELVSSVRNIPKGSRLAVSTNLMAALIAVCMRATSQIDSLSGGLASEERSMLAARSILGEWLGGSGGGWQDSGGVWPGIKRIEGCEAKIGDQEHGTSRGRLVPQHTVFEREDIPEESRQKLQNSLILIHGGLAQNVGPILEMVTERYLLRDKACWDARQEALLLTAQIEEALRAGDIKEMARLTSCNFFGPIKTIIPWASNAFTENLIEQVSEELGEQYWGFWMLGGMSGGGMGLIVDPSVLDHAKERIAIIVGQLKEQYRSALPFAIDPVIYDFEINEQGSTANFGDFDMPTTYDSLRLPDLLRKKPNELSVQDQQDLLRIRRRATEPSTGEIWLEAILPSSAKDTGAESSDLALDDLLAENGFDLDAHQHMREQLLEGRIGLSQNRLSQTTRIEDVEPEDFLNFKPDSNALTRGQSALENGEVAIVTLAAGAGSRWTQGAGVVKALHPFAAFGGRYRNFIETHLAKSRLDGSRAGVEIPHVFTTSYLTDAPIRAWYERQDAELVHRASLSKGSFVGLRLVPTIRDLRFAWEETPQPRLDAQAEKMRTSVRTALKRWAKASGEATDYRDNLPEQCLHPVGHWYELPGLLLNGTLKRLLTERPQLQTLLLHNIDTLGASLDAELLGLHLQSGNTLNYELISRRVDDVGGGLARVDGHLRLIEGLAMPHEDDEFKLRYYNTLTTWVQIDALLHAFGLDRTSLGEANRVKNAVIHYAQSLPAYMTLKEVKKRWGRGQEDVYPVLQFERLWGDMSANSDISTGYFHVPRLRGQQLKDPAQLDSWYRDGSHAYIEGICCFD